MQYLIVGTSIEANKAGKTKKGFHDKGNAITSFKLAYLERKDDLVELM